MGKFKLNPFTSATQICCELPEAAQVMIHIFNMLGQRVWTLLAENQPAGLHQAFWRGVDHADHEVPSEVYIYQIHVVSRTKNKVISSSQKLVLLH